MKNKPEVIVIGGGWAGISASVAAAQAGAAVSLYERTDMLLGTGLVGGIMRNNGRFTAAEEAIAMGLGDILHVIDSSVRHQNIEFPGHKHASLYDIATIEPKIKALLSLKGVQIHTHSRIKDVHMNGEEIVGVILDSGEEIQGDVFIDTTGSAGPFANCRKYGNGCAMCILRCHSYGGRVSVAEKAGAQEYVGVKADGTIGAMSGSCKLLKESLADDIVEQLNREGVVVVPIPEHLRKGKDILSKKACQQYALDAFAENVVLLDTGHAKLMSPYYPLELLRQIPGFENARYEDPYSGDMGNSMRYMAMAPRDNFLKVNGIENLFCGGEKTGPMVGHTEAIVTGALAGHNAARHALKMELLEVPTSLAIGDCISYVNAQVKTKEGLGKKYTFSGSVYFERMLEKGLYHTDIDVIKTKVEELGMANIFAKPLV